MKNILMSLLFVLPFASEAYSQSSSGITDPYNTWKTLGVFVVFVIALVLLYKSSRRKATQQDDVQPEIVATPKINENDSEDEAIAVIAMFLNDEMEVHDQESEIITFKKTVQDHSPWGSKVLGFKRLPNKK